MSLDRRLHAMGFSGLAMGHPLLHKLGPHFVPIPRTELLASDRAGSRLFNRYGRLFRNRSLATRPTRHIRRMGFDGLGQGTERATTVCVDVLTKIHASRLAKRKTQVKRDSLNTICSAVLSIGA